MGRGCFEQKFIEGRWEFETVMASHWLQTRTALLLSGTCSLLLPTKRGNLLSSCWTMQAAARDVHESPPFVASQLQFWVRFSLTHFHKGIFSTFVYVDISLMFKVEKTLSSGVRQMWVQIPLLTLISSHLSCLSLSFVFFTMQINNSTVIIDD